VVKPDTSELNDGADARERIVAAAASLIAAGGRDAATTRAVAAAAGVQAPTIYRLFGDKQGLLDAVAEHVLADYVAKKLAREPHPDPVQALRDGWDTHIAFGLAHPELFAIMSADPRPRSPLPHALAGLNVLQQRIRNIASAGRLKLSEERALALIQAAGVGTVLVLLGQARSKRDAGLAVCARETVMAAIIGEASARPDRRVQQTAAALRSSLDQTSALSDGERHLLTELLERIANS
jgi:AcrR family transcriptional regulator